MLNSIRIIYSPMNWMSDYCQTHSASPAISLFFYSPSLHSLLFPYLNILECHLFIISSMCKLFLWSVQRECLLGSTNVCSLKAFQRRSISSINSVSFLSNAVPPPRPLIVNKTWIHRIHTKGNSLIIIQYIKYYIALILGK